MDKETLLALYGTEDVEAIGKSKQSDKQTRVYSAVLPSRVSMNPDECKKLCAKIGKEYLPGYESRVLSYQTTNETPDRYGDVVRAAGARLESYLKNPVVMFSHQHDNYPVGCSLRISIDKKAKNIPAQALFLDDRVDTSGRADLVYKFASSGFMPACSIGFMPIKCNRPTSQEERSRVGLGDYGVEYTEWDYLEFSPCSIPANPDALQNALKSCDLKSANFEQKDIDALVLAEWFEVNLLDHFVETIRGKVGRTFVIPTIKTEPETPAAPAVEPLTEVNPDTASEDDPLTIGTTNDNKVTIQSLIVNAPIAFDMTPILEAVKAITEPLTKFIEQTELRTNAIIDRLDQMSVKQTPPANPGDGAKQISDIYERVMSEGINIRVKP